MRPKRRMEDVRDRIARNIEVADDGCWVWQGTLTKDGYGFMRVGQTPHKAASLAHRVAYFSWFGPIPQRCELHHMCERRACVNPKHLVAVTRQEHAKLGHQAVKDHCKHGHPFDVENTIYRGNGNRSCRECNRQAVRKSREKKRSEVAA